MTRSTLKLTKHSNTNIVLIEIESAKLKLSQSKERTKIL